MLLNLIALLALTAADNDGFVSIFNGKNFDGWEGKTDSYIIEDGAIKTKGKGNIYTKKEYSDFILRFEVKLNKSANNGIGIRNLPAQGKASLESQILDNSSPKYAKLQAAQYPWITL